MSVTNEQKQECIATLVRMTELLGFPVEVAEKEGAETFTLSVQTGDAGRLIGRKGHYLMSLELLLNRIMRKRFEQCPWVDLDVDGYQKKARRPRGERGGGGEVVDAARFETMAVDAAKEVKKWGEVRKLGPFSARERRVIHLTLKDDREVVTESEAIEGSRQKKVVVRLADGRPPVEDTEAQQS